MLYFSSNFFFSDKNNKEKNNWLKLLPPQENLKLREEKGIVQILLMEL